MSSIQNQFLDCFTPNGVKELQKRIEECTYPDQTIVFLEGAAPDGVYLILKGKIRLTKDSDGHTVELAVLEEGNYFGELAVIDGAVRSAQAITLGEARLAKIPSDHVVAVLETEPSQTALLLFRRVFEGLRAINEKFVDEKIRKEKLHVIGEAAGAIIHDFRNPITAIQWSANLLKSKHSDPVTQKRCDLIVAQSDRMVVMVQELLDFTKGKPHLKLEKISVGKFFEQFQSLNADFLSEKQVDFIVQPSDELIEIDVARMLRVFQNLVANAVEAIRSKASITLSFKVKGERIELAIADNGPGIPESIRKNLFDAFVTHGKANGTGLGTAIAKMMVERHEGTIRFETETGKGTTFFIELKKA